MTNGSDDAHAYPLEIRGDLSDDLSRWLWLVKWILAIPHLFLLILLSIAAFFVWFVAWWGILFTGRYPRALFDFIVGVMRWWWRVSFYAFRPLGTDRYPPFTLASRDDYPADLYVEYPEQLSRIKIFFKWWLLAIPHYIVVTFFLGMQTLLENAIQTIFLGIAVLEYGDLKEEGVAEHAWTLIITGASSLPFAAIAAFGLAGVLALIAVITLLFRGRYPQDMFEFLMGMERWSYRVSGYAALLYDDYPPFRLKP